MKEKGGKKYKRDNGNESIYLVRYVGSLFLSMKLAEWGRRNNGLPFAYELFLSKYMNSEYEFKFPISFIFKIAEIHFEKG